MSNYGYNQAEYLITEAEAIDKDGFHKKVIIEEESSSGSGELEENVYSISNNIVKPSQSGQSNPFTVIFNKNRLPESFTNIETRYFYFGDPIDDSEIHIVLDEYVFIDDSDCARLNIITANMSYDPYELSDEYAALMSTVTEESLPSGWENMQLHAIVTYSASSDDKKFFQIHHV